MTARRYQAVPALFAALSLGSCTSWQPAAVSPARVITEDVRVTKTDGSVVVLRNPEVRTDSIVSDVWRFPMADIQRIEVKRTSAGRTIALSLVIPAYIVIGCSVQPDSCFR